MNRNLQVDFFRGFLLILITVNHFVSEDNILIRITREGIGWVTGAEGFVYLSGFTVGLVYSGKYLKEGKRFIRTAAFKRAWLIYKYHVAILVITFLAVLLLPIVKEYWRGLYASFLDEPVMALALGGLFLYQPTNLDILPMYAIFLLYVPLAVRLYHSGFGWQCVSLGSSFLFYLIGTFDLLPVQITRYPWVMLVETGNFEMLAWQFIFFMGVFFGYLRYHGQLDKVLDSELIAAGSILIVLGLFLLKNLLSVGFVALPEKFDMSYWTDKKFLRPLRVLNVAVLFITIRFLMVKKGNWFLTERIRYLGKYSLEVFSFHIILVLMLKPFKPMLNSFFSVHLVGKYYLYPLELLLLAFIILALYGAPPIWEKSSQSYRKLKETLLK